ncbi:MAG: ABC transporter substrate-binding protein [Phycisphaerales bacterium]|nr:ABC transporter substrate-binding protein [Phycisphaerales bacterium]
MTIASATSNRPVLTLGHSPDPDDVFMWWPVTGMVDPADHSRVVESPAIDTGRFRYAALPADIQVLNRRAIEQGDLDITAISVNTYPRIAAKYRMTSFGGSVGYGYGPKIVVRDDSLLRDVQGLTRGTGAPARIAVPGRDTTAFLLLCLSTGARPGELNTVEAPFDRILGMVASREVEAGLLIHQSQLTFADLGLRQLIDVGKWWLDETAFPLPLGANAVRRDLDERFGPGSLADVVRTLDHSIRYALGHRQRSTDYAMRFAPELSREQTDAYIDMYVNDLTIDAGQPGREAMVRLFEAAYKLGMIDRVPPLDLASPDG